MEQIKTGAGSGPGSGLPVFVLAITAIATIIAVVVGAMSIHLQLKNYRKPHLQRMVVRIMVMVPIYAVSSLIALFSLEAAFVIDVIRDIYEAFVIYCFFSLLISYLGGERSLLILLHGRPPKDPLFPLNLFQSEIDPSDPHTFLFLKRGILQYVQVKPVLAVATLILKALGLYQEGNFSANSGYLYVTVIYNASICLSLYCLATFWLCINEDLKGFRPIPKFLCVKGILFFSFWQSLAISIAVASHVITKLGPYKEPEYISLGLTDTLICLEMPFFALAHLYAFSYKDYIDPKLSYVARMPMYYAFWDAFGTKDVVEDSRATLKGKGMNYREFEPAEGHIHQGVARSRRIRAGLRYSKGGKRKYWLPRITRDADSQDEAHAPLLTDEAESVVHVAPDLMDEDWNDPNSGFELPFGDLDETDEELFSHSKRFLFGDYNYPCIDVSTEAARAKMWDEEERVLRDERGAWFSSIRGAKGRVAIEQRDSPAWEGYGAIGSHPRPNSRAKGKWKEHGDQPTNGAHAEIVIDFEQDRAPPEESGDVRLKWTRANIQSSRPSTPNVTTGRPLVYDPPPPPKIPWSRANSYQTVSSTPRRSSGRDGKAEAVKATAAVRQDSSARTGLEDGRPDSKEPWREVPQETVSRVEPPPVHIRSVLDTFGVPDVSNENPWA